jgi:Ti-type conjugative transfer relaxase TraA
MKPIARSGGRSAVAAAAYRAAEMLTNDRDGLTHDFRAKEGVEHTEIVLPKGVNADWARDRSTLWNAAEKAECRKDARVAREFEVALPYELTADERVSLTRAFAQDLADRHGAAVDFAVHRPHSDSDRRNHHAHILMTTRHVTRHGLTDKTYIERENKWLVSNGLPPSQLQLRDIRQSFEQLTNEHLANAGFDIRVDHRSHVERGLEIMPTEHAGVHATQMERRGLDVSRARLDAVAARHNTDLILEKPEQVLAIVTGEKSVFDQYDVARTLHRYINDDMETFRSLMTTIFRSPEVVELQPERMDASTGEIEPARYSTREMIDLETGMAHSAERLYRARGHGVDCHHVERAIQRQDAAMQARGLSNRAAAVEAGGRELSIGNATPQLSDEQRAAIVHIARPERIAAVVGYAGAGKSTMLAAARQAWEVQGYNVHGAALSGKAAEGLSGSSGIASRTLASWEAVWQNERHLLGHKDVFVIDEAGMVSSRQLARFVHEVEQSGAKLVLVGDHEQLQAIGAGAPFRTIAEQIGYAELLDIRRQHTDWQRQASVSFATHKTAEGLDAYRQHGHIRLSETDHGVRREIVRDYLADIEDRPDGSRIAMAHRRSDVRAINGEIRSALQDRLRLGRGEEGGEVSYATDGGRRDFAHGDRLVFLQNDRDLGVTNGMLGTVSSVAPQAIVVRLDGGGGGEPVNPRTVTIPTKTYRAFDHGYAITIHKSQGMTVDRAFVMASQTMDRHLTYVAMTRHRDDVTLYASQAQFADRATSRLVDHGRAPYKDDPSNRDSYFATLEDHKGEQHTVWGVDLQRAVKEAAPAIGSKIALEHRGSEPVYLPDGQITERHRWNVSTADDVAFRSLRDRLGRSGVKQTTLDYTREFARRRGIEADVPIGSRTGQDRFRGEAGQENDASTTLGRKQDHPAVREARADIKRQVQEPATNRGAERQRSERRGMFDGLKLRAGERGSSSSSKPSHREVGLRAASISERRDTERGQDRMRPMSSVEQSVDRFARAASAIAKMDRDGLPILEGQKAELQQASKQLDKQQPGSSGLLVSAMQHDQGTQQAIDRLSGRERVGQLVAAMERERALQADPDVRADRLIDTWQKLQAERLALIVRQDQQARETVEGEMQRVARAIERDPQVKTIVHHRASEVGISHIRQEGNIARAMAQSIERGRGDERER